MAILSDVKNFSFAALGSCVSTMGLSCFFLSCCIAVWALPPYVVQDFLTFINKKAMTDANAVHIMAVGSIIEIISIVIAGLAIDGIVNEKAGMILTHVIYLPMYILYQLVVLILMIVYLVNKSSYNVVYRNKDPSTTGRDLMASYVLPFLPILVCWIVHAALNIGGVVIMIYYYRQLRKEKEQLKSEPSRTALLIDKSLRGPNYDSIYDRIYLGNYLAAANATQYGFTHVLNCAKELEFAEQDDVVYKKIPIKDGNADPIEPEYIKQAVEWLRKVNQADNKVLVNCHAGVSRSASIVIAFIYAENPNSSYNQIVDFVKQKRFIIPHAGLEDTLEKLYPRK